ncbi:HAMP domain-containing sensor histidine kinase, partial [Balneolaceae bacterium ANBcel3]|nr:HAMP domain-containing sensor histidine kinase [Balneolaceae bacterium ANBcel3]
QLINLNSEINRLQRELTKEKVLLERTLNELEKANDELKSLNDEKNRFLNMAAHDLRSPISTAISYLDMLMHFPDQFSEDQKKEFLKNTDERLRHSIDLMTELLDFTKIESGMTQLDKGEHNMTELVEQTIEFNRLLASNKNIRISSSLPEHPLILSIDRNKVEQVLNNLISNALKFSYKNTEIKIKVTANIDAISVSVKDHGVGIPEKDQPHVFTPYHKSSSQPTAGESSTGLGLAISKRIVEEHGGTMHLESAEKKGSTFTFTLPIST